MTPYESGLSISRGKWIYAVCREFPHTAFTTTLCAVETVSVRARYRLQCLLSGQREKTNARGSKSGVHPFAVLRRSSCSMSKPLDVFPYLISVTTSEDDAHICKSAT